MPAVRVRPALVALAVLLSACGTAVGTGGVASHTAAWQAGYHVGQDARSHHRFKRGHNFLDVDAFCVTTAYRDIQTMKGSLVQWTDGFYSGCRHGRHRHHARRHPSGTPAPR